MNIQSKRSRELQAVVLDWAGTTVDFGCCGPVQAFIESFTRFGIQVTPAEAREPMGMGKREHVAALCAMPRIAELWQAKYGHTPDSQDIDAIYRDVEKTMLDVIREYAIPIPGTVEAVDGMRGMGLKIGSCTGYPRSVAERVAVRAKEYGYEPDVIICATDVPHSRPAPDMCAAALARLGVDNPAKAVKIGDTVNDVLEGLRAGMWVIGITLTGSLAGLSQEAMAALSQVQRTALHERITHTLLTAGAHFTAPDLAACLEHIRKWDTEGINTAP